MEDQRGQNALNLWDHRRRDENEAHLDFSLSVCTSNTPFEPRGQLWMGLCTHTQHRFLGATRGCTPKERWTTFRTFSPHPGIPRHGAMVRFHDGVEALEYNTSGCLGAQLPARGGGEGASQVQVRDGAHQYA